MNKPSILPFKRTTLVWTLYILCGLYTFVQTMIGPIIPYLRNEFSLDYTFAALHISAFAVGMIVSGLIAPRLLRFIGMMRALWLGMGGILVGLTGLVLAPHPIFSLGSIFFMSVTGTIAPTVIQAGLSHLFPVHRSKAMMEAGVVCSLTSAVAPFVIAVGGLYFLGWRSVWPVFLVAVVVVAILGLPSTKALAQDDAEAAAPPDGHLPRAFWGTWFLIVLAISVEWCVSFWSAEHLKGLPERSLELAAAGAGVFQLASLAGRAITSRLAGRFQERGLLTVAMIFVLVGFPFYWLRLNAVLAFAGLVFCGLGASTFYPLTGSLCMGAAGGQISRASSYVVIGAGVAIFSAPLLLGWIADKLDLSTALWSIPIGVVLMAILLFLESRRREAPTGST
ncbi:MFS transporter [Sorangium sp. So ce1128]